MPQFLIRVELHGASEKDYEILHDAMTLSDQAGEEFDDTLTKAEVSKKIDEIQQKTGRGAE